VPLDQLEEHRRPVLDRLGEDLQRVLDSIVSVEGVVRSSTLISLAAQVPYRVLPLVRAAASGTGPQRPADGYPGTTALSNADQAVC
jgi:hypothetical protein